MTHPLSVEDALALMLEAVAPLPLERVPLAEARGRTLGAEMSALRSHPSADVSAMDGYAVRSEDVSPEVAEGTEDMGGVGGVSPPQEGGRAGEKDGAIAPAALAAPEKDDASFGTTAHEAAVQKDRLAGAPPARSCTNVGWAGKMMGGDGFEARKRFALSRDRMPHEECGVSPQNQKPSTNEEEGAGRASENSTPLKGEVGGKAPHMKLVGTLAAGGEPPAKSIAAGETMRIFTGAKIPEGADAILIQEHARADGDRIHPTHPVSPGLYVRKEGSDFARGDTLLPAGRRLRDHDLALLAAMGHAQAPTHQRPRIALLALGSELAALGDPHAEGKLISSNSIGMAAFVEKLGGEAVDLGIAPDDESAIAEAARAARHCDMLVTMGGASVGDYDLAAAALARAGYTRRFHGVAMRPGKPLLFAINEDGKPAVGMPGNPVSTLVCAEVFLRPLLDRMQGGSGRGLPRIEARLTCALPANGARQEYMRARLAFSPSDVHGNEGTGASGHGRAEQDARARDGEVLGKEERGGIEHAENGGAGHAGSGGAEHAKSGRAGHAKSGRAGHGEGGDAGHGEEGRENGRGGYWITPFVAQDSARLSTLSRAEALAIRPPHAPPAAPGDTIPALRLDGA